eukprot:TRINITY_DN6170_c0_g1_i1.p1 TRINITY_DN6170_c0_g1~~TRINITY_DN6170_c0_g1_i1.p1  ORF type:complete len:483 (-),score=116.57 TRINITY_DN6170_c0_g1_i1:583-1995(-)
MANPEEKFPSHERTEEFPSFPFLVVTREDAELENPESAAQNQTDKMDEESFYFVWTKWKLIRQMPSPSEEDIVTFRESPSYFMFLSKRGRKACKLPPGELIFCVISQDNFLESFIIIASSGLYCIEKNPKYFYCNGKKKRNYVSWEELLQKRLLLSRNTHWVYLGGRYIINGGSKAKHIFTMLQLFRKELISTPPFCYSPRTSPDFETPVPSPIIITHDDFVSTTETLKEHSIQRNLQDSFILRNRQELILLSFQGNECALSAMEYEANQDFLLFQSESSSILHWWKDPDVVLFSNIGIFFPSRDEYISWDSFFGFTFLHHTHGSLVVDGGKKLCAYSLPLFIAFNAFHSVIRKQIHDVPDFDPPSYDALLASSPSANLSDGGQPHSRSPSPLKSPSSLSPLTATTTTTTISTTTTTTTTTTTPIPSPTPSPSSSRPTVGLSPGKDSLHHHHHHHRNSEEKKKEDKGTSN